MSDYLLSQLSPAFLKVAKDPRQVLVEDTMRQLAKQAGIGDFSGFMKGVSGAVKQLGVKAPAAEEQVAAKAKRSFGGPLGWKGNALLLGGTVGAGILASKAMRVAPQVLSQEEQPATYGAGQYGYQVPYGVNSYGQPQI